MPGLVQPQWTVFVPAARHQHHEHTYTTAVVPHSRSYKFKLANDTAVLDAPLFPSESHRQHHQLMGAKKKQVLQLRAETSCQTVKPTAHL